jgi:hypothetical protein
VAGWQRCFHHPHAAATGQEYQRGAEHGFRSSDSLSSGRRIKCLTVVDDFSKESVDITVDYGISGQYVTRVLDQVARFRATRQQCERTMAQSSPVGRSWPGHTRTGFDTS